MFIVLKARHLSSSAFCNFHRLEVPEHFGIVVRDRMSISFQTLCAISSVDAYLS